MTTVCTCPSGDGSLRWPCPTHPPMTTPPPCLNCDCPWNSCLIHAEFCCDACAHFDAEDEK